MKGEGRLGGEYYVRDVNNGEQGNAMSNYDIQRVATPLELHLAGGVADALEGQVPLPIVARLSGASQSFRQAFPPDAGARRALETFGTVDPNALEREISHVFERLLTEVRGPWESYHKELQAVVARVIYEVNDSKFTDHLRDTFLKELRGLDDDELTNWLCNEILKEHHPLSKQWLNTTARNPQIVVENGFLRGDVAEGLRSWYRQCVDQQFEKLLEYGVALRSISCDKLQNPRLREICKSRTPTKEYALLGPDRPATLDSLYGLLEAALKGVCILEVKDATDRPEHRRSLWSFLCRAQEAFRFDLSVVFIQSSPDARLETQWTPDMMIRTAEWMVGDAKVQEFLYRRKVPPDTPGTLFAPRVNTRIEKIDPRTGQPVA